MQLDNILTSINPINVQLSVLGAEPPEPIQCRFTSVKDYVVSTSELVTEYMEVVFQ